MFFRSWEGGRRGWKKIERDNRERNEGEKDEREREPREDERETRTLLGLVECKFPGMKRERKEGGRRRKGGGCIRERRKERENERPTHPQNSRGIRQCSSRAWDAISGRMRVEFVLSSRGGPPVQMHHGLFRGSCVELMREALSTLPFCLPMIDRTGAFRLRHNIGHM